MKVTPKLKWAALVVLPITSIALFGFGMKLDFHGVTTSDGKEIPQGNPLTSAQIQQLQNGVNGIGFPYGEFIRSHKLGNFPESEIAYSKDDAINNPNTQEIILPYGIFIRETKGQQKSEELNDPQWAAHHKFEQGDQAIIQSALAKHAAETSSSTK